jgi:short-subunit dehydrogenase
MFGEALRHELSGTGVSLTLVYPGEVATALHDHELDRLPDWHRGGEQAAEATGLSARVIAAVEADERAVYYPAAVRALGMLHGLSPTLSDRVLRSLRGGTAAPRVD